MARACTLIQNHLIKLSINQSNQIPKKESGVPSVLHTWHIPALAGFVFPKELCTYVLFGFRQNLSVTVRSPACMQEGRMFIVFGLREVKGGGGGGAISRRESPANRQGRVTCD